MDGRDTVADVVVVGAGPAGLMAAETLAEAGLRVVVCEKMPTPARRLLMAGRGGLNLTHSEGLDAFLARYEAASGFLEPAVRAFPPEALVSWAEGLGQACFTGSSGRIFPKSLKASPLLRAWLARLSDLGVDIRTRWTWEGWSASGALSFATPEGQGEIAPRRGVILALGGASWPRLGSDGSWTGILASKGVKVTPLGPANCGFQARLGAAFLERFQGEPLKGVALTFNGRVSRGEIMITRYGLEGGLIYAVSSDLKREIARSGFADILLDLRPEMTSGALTGRLAKSRPGESLSNRLRKSIRLTPAASNLLREADPNLSARTPAGLASLIKATPIRLTAPQGLERAISTSGGVSLDALKGLELAQAPGVFVAGEMIDWEAPTGGYLLQASFATGRAAALALLKAGGDEPPVAWRPKVA